MVWTVLSTALIYIGTLNTILARFAGTCTQGDADRLIGVVWSIPFFFFANFILLKTKYPGWTMVAWLPALAILLWQAIFSVNLAFDIAMYQFSACEVLEGVEYPMSGSELVYSIIWPFVTFGTLLMVAATYISRR